MKKTQLLLLTLLLALPFNAWAQQPLRGDVDLDGSLSIGDVTALMDYLLTNDATGISLANADTDRDGAVSVSDVILTIDYLLKGSWPDDPVTPPTEGDWVDLGLPSGTIWATRNIGASAPEDSGDYFAWGETTPKDYYGWNDYKWCNGSNSTITKYCTDSGYGYYGLVDNKTELDPEDDAAYVNWGSVARMPSLEQIQELYDNCTWQRTQHNGVNGMLATGPNGNTIFLPAAGCRWNESLDLVESCYFWSRSLYSGRPSSAWCLYFFSSGYGGWSINARYYGQNVRAVRVS